MDWFLYDRDLSHERVKLCRKLILVMFSKFSLKFKSLKIYLPQKANHLLNISIVPTLSLLITSNYAISWGQNLYLRLLLKACFHVMLRNCEKFKSKV